VAYIVSFLTMVICVLLIHNLFIDSFLTGFYGVFSGAFFFPRSNQNFRNRVFGSALLLIAGLVFEVQLYLKNIPPAPPAHIPLSALDIFATALGGLAAGGLRYKLRPREDTKGVPALPAG
jgi:hypothetical protein